MGFDFMNEEGYEVDNSDVGIKDADEVKSTYPILFNAEQLPARALKEKKKGRQKLKIKHRKMIAMHLSGIPTDLIAKQIGCNVVTVNTILRDPLAKSVISEFAETHIEEFNRLEILANASLRDALQPYKRDSVRLKAAGLYYNRKRDTDIERPNTAEDVMANLMQIIHAENVQINLVNNQAALMPLEEKL